MKIQVTMDEWYIPWILETEHPHYPYYEVPEEIVKNYIEAEKTLENAIKNLGAVLRPQGFRH